MDGNQESSIESEESLMVSRELDINYSIGPKSQTNDRDDCLVTRSDSTTLEAEVCSRDRSEDSLSFHLEDNSARDVMEMLLKRVENYEDCQKCEPQFDKKFKFSKDNISNLDHKHEERHKVDNETKLDPLIHENRKSREGHEIQITKELIEFEKQHHLNAINSIKTNNVEICQEPVKSSEKNYKDRHTHNYHNIKLEKENIQFDKSFDKVSLNVSSLSDKKHIDNEKNDDRIRLDREKIRHNKDRLDKDKNDSEKEKAKSSKAERSLEKDKRPKDDQYGEKMLSEKSDKTRTDKDVEKPHKDKNDKDIDKTKNLDERSYRHDHHKKDRSERDKRKDSIDNETSSTKKKDDKHKHERTKKENELKRDGKKETESLRNRKSSRDENTRDLCRKDSTDSSTSRASHESSKVKDLETNDAREDVKPKYKHSELFVKLDGEKEILLKTEIKEEKDLGSAGHNKHKNETSHEHSTKSKLEITEKQRHYSLDSPSVDSKRKERLSSCSSLPSNIGHKRRMSSQDSIDLFNEDVKKCKGDAKHPERRDSKDSRSESRHKTTKFSKGHFAKILESKTKDDKKNQVKPPDDSFVEYKESDSKDHKNLERIKSFKKSPKEENEEKSNTETPPEGLQNDLDFLATLELRSSEEDERQRALRKEMKEKKRIQQLQQIQELQMQQDAMHHAEFKGKDEKKLKCEDKKKETAREKRLSTDRKSRDEKIDHSKRKSRKPVHSSDSSDSDEPKKHSIFDIIDDGPTYISMYDKVKARSCKNMQKQEEEKRQEKIKAKFSQLKQSRAKREEKKRSSWDEDSDSDQDRKKYHKSSGDNSSDDDIVIHTKKREKSFDLDRIKTDDYYDGSTNDEDMRNKLSRKNSRTRIMSDTSDDETSKRSISKSPNFLDSIKKEHLSDSEPVQRTKSEECKDSNENHSKKNSLLNLFGKSDSDDSKLKLNVDNDNGYKSSYIKSMCNDFSSGSESACNKNCLDNRRKHKKKQKKHRSAYSDDENKIDNSETNYLDGYKHKTIEKQRRHSNKKDKRKDKLRESVDTDDTRDEKIKLKKDKKSNNNFDINTEIICNSIKKEGKMEDIFGPLSDESDRDTRGHLTHKSDFSSHEIESSFCTNNSEYKLKDDKRKKERKRKENRYFKEDENSLDVDAVSKAIEARLFADVMIDDDSRNKVETLSESLNKIENINDIKYVEGNIISEVVKHEKLKRECKEKKKKKKKSREERQSRKEHINFYSQEKTDIAINHNLMENIEVSPKTMLLDIPLPNDDQSVSIIEKMENCKTHLEKHSLPRLTDSPPIVIQSDENTDSKSVDSSNVVIDDSKMDYVEGKEIEIEEIPMPPPFETIVTDISEVPLPKDPLPSKLNHNREDCFLSSLSSDGDSCEDAVRNIINPENDLEKTDRSPDLLDILPCKSDKKTDEKPRAIISQEETEDAVAALLGESFGGKTNSFSSYEETENNSTLPSENEGVTIETENIPEEDAEEMRQAVQNLNASEMEMKPDTPVSDNDLLLIDTDTEENDETPQDNLEKLPVNIIPTSQTVTANSEPNKCNETSNLVPEAKSNIVTTTTPVTTTTATSTSSESNIKNTETDVKIQLTKRENVQIITSTATPVITSWTLTNNKLLEPHVVNVQTNSQPATNKNELKPTHITANIVQIKGPQNQAVQINNSSRPMISQTRLNAPYQVINQMIRSQSPNMQPPTIKIPEPHILYQKPQGIVISPRMSNDPRMQSPKANSQTESLTSPRLKNMAVISTSPQNINAVGKVSPNTIQQRSPGQVTVVRMQQPPLSPIQAMHIPHGARTMLSPNRPNSVLVQTQGAPIHFNRLPVTPVLTPISKQLSVNNMPQQNKGISVTTTPLIHQQKMLSSDCRKGEQRSVSENHSESSKIILSPTNLQHSTNPTVMAQNRLISMQNAMHTSNKSTIHLNKVLINSVNQLNDKRENTSQKSDKINHVPFGPTPIIHVAGVNTAYTSSTTSIIQGGTKSVVTSGQETNTISRNQGSNVIHSLNSQRIVTQSSLSNVIKIDANKVPTSVLSMATVRPPSVLAKLELATSPTATTTTTNVTPLLLKTTSATAPARLNNKFEKDNTEPQKSLIVHNHARENEIKHDEKNNFNKLIVAVSDTIKEQKDIQPKPISSPVENVLKCGTDFEELLKDNTNEIKITKDSDNNLEINVGKPVITNSNQNRDKDVIKSVSSFKKENQVEITPSQFHTIPSFSIKEEKNTINSIEPTKVLSHFENSKLETPSETVAKEEAVIGGNENNAETNETGDAFKLENDVKDEDMIHTILPEDSKENSNCSIKNDENDSWSAKDVNIESVIKKVESLCNEIVETNDSINEIDKEFGDSIKMDLTVKENLNFHTPHIKSTTLDTKNTQIETPVENNILEDTVTDKIIPTVTAKRGGRSVRGKRLDKNQDRVQTRQISKPARGSGSVKRGRGRAKVDKKIKSLVNNSTSTMPGDVYDFHEDSGDEAASSPNKTETRPRLILTIKSPLSGNSTMTATSTLSITQKDQMKCLDKNKEEKSEEFVSPSPNTRKSRRLQEKDVQRSTVDDIIEDVIKGPTGQFKTGKDTNKKRPIRQAVVKANQDKTPGIDTRKSPRGVKRTRDRSLSDASMDSGDERPIRECTKDAKTPRIEEPTPESEPVPVLRPAPLIHAPPSLPVTMATTTPTTTPTNTPTTTPTPTPAPTPVTVSTPVLAPVPTPILTSTPITKPPKKMISEISAKLAGAFDAVVAVNPAVVAVNPAVVAVNPAVVAVNPAERAPSEAPASPLAGGGGGEARARRLAEAVPGALVPVGATEATDARVVPALPHRPPSAPSTPAMHRPADRATPLLIIRAARPGPAAERAADERAPTSLFDERGADGDAAGGGAAGAAASARAFRGYAATASLPRGAHHPPHPPPDHHLKQVAVVGPQQLHHHPGTARVAIASVPSISPQGQMGMGEGMYPHFSHQHYQMYQQHFRATQHESRATPSPYTSRSLEAEGSEAPTPPLELRRPPSARVPPRRARARPGARAAPRAHTRARRPRLPPRRRAAPREPPPAHCSRLPPALPPHVGPPHASQVPREADSLQMLLRRYPVMWQGLLALKNDSAAVQMHFVGGNPGVAGDTLSRHADGSTPLLRIAQRMRLEQPQLDQVHRKMKMENEHCMLLALPCGRDHMDVLQQSTNLTSGFITYLQQKQAAGIVNIAPPGHHQAMFTVHIFPSCEFANENLNRIAPDLMHRVADIAHLLIVIATV
ncbi:unnamed protein product [Chrysodeixis includens]|uniref:SPOC domain-containing protein n=1 Tax=Chrysodeixis includens TaxID=689277 RepID=A0A9N8KWF9_CHRIL|nr:unnamed protein product [Chrysodeixis includens]